MRNNILFPKSSKQLESKNNLTHQVAAGVILTVLAIGSSLLALILSAALAKLLVYAFGVETVLGGAVLVTVLALAGLLAWLWKMR